MVYFKLWGIWKRKQRFQLLMQKYDCTDGLIQAEAALQRIELKDTSTKAPSLLR